MTTDRIDKPEGTLRRGWTTGACATAATKAALTALVTGEFPDPVEITLPKGETPSFPLALESLNDGGAMAGIVKDAGDDPDVTHGATIITHVVPMEPGSGVQFFAGPGVGTVTKPGLPINPGEAAINPVPRQMMRDVVAEICGDHGLPPDLAITISVPGGEDLAAKTWNPRLGIVGGLSILGTTGIVKPFSCSSWIHSIHRGIDVARAEGLESVIAATGSTSEAAARKRYDLPETACLDMGDFAGGTLKYLRQHPVPKLVLAGGFAKFVKLAQGALDLHSGRSQVDHDWLANCVEILMSQDGKFLNQDMKSRIQGANTAAETLEIANGLGISLADHIARLAHQTARDMLRDAPVAVDVMIVDRSRNLIGLYPHQQDA